MENTRVVVWFSCGATSAVAAKLAIQKYGHEDLVIAYCDTGSEHPSNAQFMANIARWTNHPVEVLKSDTYANVDDVIERTRYLDGVAGARCTTELKKSVRLKFQQPDDIQIFGFDSSEIKRAAKFRKHNPEVMLETPLIEAGLDHGACLAMLVEAGITLPAMYLPQKSGAPYNHNNCIGCVKGGMGYWNKIRVDFPEVFALRAKQEREIGHAICATETKGRKKIPVYLDELPPDAGRFDKEKPMVCDLLCNSILKGFTV